MNLPIALTLVYLAINLAMMLWLEVERANGRSAGPRVSAMSMALRYGPPLLGLIYIEMIAGDWLFLVFVVAFFVLGFWLMDGLLATTTPARDPHAWPGAWDGRSAERSARPDRDHP
jgi:hypothetical protein